jgi:predicted DCC family thiol-disulfide oxidoreductase YuxK
LVAEYLLKMPPVRILDEVQRSAALAFAPRLGASDVLIFDGDCRFCIAQVARLKRLARGGNAQAGGDGPLVEMPLQTAGLLDAVRVSHDEAMAAMHLVLPDGRIYRGLEAAVQAMRHRPILGKLVMLYYVPGIKQLADLGYRIVARYRYAIMGRAVARGECHGSCAIHLRPPGASPPS